MKWNPNDHSPSKKRRRGNKCDDKEKRTHNAYGTTRSNVVNRLWIDSGSMRRNTNTTFRQRNFHIFIITILLLKSKWICKSRWYIDFRIEERERASERGESRAEMKGESIRKRGTLNKTKSNEHK